MNKNVYNKKLILESCTKILEKIFFTWNFEQKYLKNQEIFKGFFHKIWE